MGKSASAPESPNPAVTIPLQTQANMQSFNQMLEASRANTTTPYGSMSWSKTPSFNEQAYNEALSKWQSSPDLFKNSGEYQAAKPSRDAYTTNSWTYNTEFSPEQQQLYDANIQSQLGQAGLLDALTQRVGQATSKPVDYSGLPELTGSVSPTTGAQGGMDLGLMSNLDPNAANDFLSGLASRSVGDNFSRDVADATYSQQTRYLDPQVQQQQRALEARLAEQGFVPGTPGYQQAMQNFMDTNARAYGSARDSAITAGYGQGNTQLGIQGQVAQLLAGLQGQNYAQRFGANQQQLGREAQAFGQQQSAATFGNQARNQALAELLTRRNQPLNELSAMRSGTQVQLPQGQATYQTPNLQTPDVIGAYNQNYQNQLGQYSANVGANNALMGDITSLVGTAMLPGSTGLFAGLGKLFGG